MNQVSTSKISPINANEQVVATRWQGRADLLGAAASFLCAMHCAITPLLLTLIPVAGLGALAGGRFEKSFIVVAAVYGAFVIGSGFCRHRLLSIVAVFVAGVAALALAGFTSWHEIAWLHALLMASGGALIGVAHLRNRKGVCECN